MIYKNKKWSDKPTHNLSYIIEENDSLRISYVLEPKGYILFFTYALVFQVMFAVALVYMIIERIGVFHIVVAILLNLCAFAFARATIINLSNHANYSLVISSQGIRNTTCKGEVFLPWSEFKKIGIVENVKIRQSRVHYYPFIYISNSALEEDYLRKIIASPDSEIYVTTDSELVIAIRPYSQEETQALYSKLTEYANKFNPNNSE